MRLDRAAVTPIGQNNPPGRLKLLVLHKKQAKIPIFDFAQKARFLRLYIRRLVEVCIVHTKPRTRYPGTSVFPDAFPPITAQKKVHEDRIMV
jgi:hypothetical protein